MLNPTIISHLRRREAECGLDLVGAFGKLPMGIGATAEEMDVDVEALDALVSYGYARRRETDPPEYVLGPPRRLDFDDFV